MLDTQFTLEILKIDIMFFSLLTNDHIGPIPLSTTKDVHACAKESGSHRDAHPKDIALLLVLEGEFSCINILDYKQLLVYGPSSPTTSPRGLKARKPTHQSRVLAHLQ